MTDILRCNCISRATAVC